MNTKLFIGNIPFVATEEDLKKFLEQAGEVVEVKIIRHRDTGKSRGFGFGEMKDEAGFKKAIEELNEQPIKIGDVERNLFVKEAKPRE